VTKSVTRQKSSKMRRGLKAKPAADVTSKGRANIVFHPAVVEDSLPKRYRAALLRHRSAVERIQAIFASTSPAIRNAESVRLYRRISSDLVKGLKGAKS